MCSSYSYGLRRIYYGLIGTPGKLGLTLLFFIPANSNLFCSPSPPSLLASNTFPKNLENPEGSFLLSYCCVVRLPLPPLFGLLPFIPLRASLLLKASALFNSPSRRPVKSCSSSSSLIGDPILFGFYKLFVYPLYPTKISLRFSLGLFRAWSTVDLLE